MTTAAGSGHPSSCLSAADIVAILFFKQMRWDPGEPRARRRYLRIGSARDEARVRD